MLTRKQLELLLFINERLKESGIPPSFDEMKDALDLRSKSGIHRLITALEERGFIRRLPNRARALEVIRLPDAVNPSFAAMRQRGFRPNVIEGRLGKAPEPQARRDEAANDSIAIPVMGRIAAGVPISAIQVHSHSIAVPPEMLGGGEHFALEVRGDSMIDAGILDGDTIILKKQDTANTGDIVVALIDDEEATLKRLRRKGASIALEAANPAYETRIFGPDRVRIQGRLTGLLRKYYASACACHGRGVSERSVVTRNAGAPSSMSIRTASAPVAREPSASMTSGARQSAGARSGVTITFARAQSSAKAAGSSTWLTSTRPLAPEQARERVAADAASERRRHPLAARPPRRRTAPRHRSRRARRRREARRLDRAPRPPCRPARRGCRAD